MPLERVVSLAAIVQGCCSPVPTCTHASTWPHLSLSLSPSPSPLRTLFQGPTAPTVSLLSHPLEPAHPVVADVAWRAVQQQSQQQSQQQQQPMSLAGWSGEAVVWSTRDLPFVATYSEVVVVLVVVVVVTKVAKMW